MISRFKFSCIDAQFALLLEAVFERGSEQFVGRLALSLQNLLFDFRFLLFEIVLVDRIVLGDAINRPNSARSETGSPAWPTGMVNAAENCLALPASGMEPVRETGSRGFHFKPKGFGRGGEVLARLGALGKFVGASLGQLHRFLMPVSRWSTRS